MSEHTKKFLEKRKEFHTEVGKLKSQHEKYLKMINPIKEHIWSQMVDSGLMERVDNLEVELEGMKEKVFEEHDPKSEFDEDGVKINIGVSKRHRITQKILSDLVKKKSIAQEVLDEILKESEVVEKTFKTSIDEDYKLLKSIKM